MSPQSLPDRHLGDDRQAWVIGAAANSLSSLLLAASVAASPAPGTSAASGMQQEARAMHECDRSGCRCQGTSEEMLQRGQRHYCSEHCADANDPSACECGHEGCGG